MFNIQPKLENLETTHWGNRVGDREKQNALQNRIRKKASGLSKVTKDNFIYLFFILMKIFTWNTFM